MECFCKFSIITINEKLPLQEVSRHGNSDALDGRLWMGTGKSCLTRGEGFEYYIIV